MKGRVSQGEIINPPATVILYTLLTADPDLIALFVPSLDYSDTSSLIFSHLLTVQLGVLRQAASPGLHQFPSQSGITVGQVPQYGLNRQHCQDTPPLHC